MALLRTQCTNFSSTLVIRRANCFYHGALFMLSLHPPLPFLLCLPPASRLVIAHHSSLCTEAPLCDYDWMRRSECVTKRRGGGGRGWASWWVCVCVGKSTITFVFLYGSAPLYRQGLAGQEQGSPVPVGWTASQSGCVCVCVCTTSVLNSLAAPFCMTRWGPLSLLTCHFNLWWPPPVIWQRSSPKTMGETVPEHVSTTWKHIKNCHQKISLGGFYKDT